MLHRTVLLAAGVALSLCRLPLSAAPEAAPNDQARFLAGLPVDGTPLATLAQQPAWAQHAAAFNKAWSSLDEGQLSAIGTWIQQTLPVEAADPSPLFYMFSGPDFLYANTFFPHASTYVLCGIEPVGTPPDVTKLPQGTLNSALSNLRNSLDSVLSFSFFITAKMKTDLRATQLTGTLPVLYVFLARQGCHIDSVELLAIDDDGAIGTEKAKTPGVRIVFHRGQEPPQKLYYFSSDLSDSGISAHPGFVRFCTQLGRGNALVKAASYLMHHGEFSAVRDFLLAQSNAIVQDDSGIPWKYFAPERWDMLTFGRYVGPIDLFKQNYQGDLAAAAKASASPSLPFSFGYRWHSNESLLIAARSMQAIPKAVPAAQPAPVAPAPQPAAAPQTGGQD